MAEKSMTDEEMIRWILACRDSEADQAKRSRMHMNKNNFAMYHLEHDFSHKKEGQSTELLSKVKMAVEQIKSFFQQALTDVGEWWSAEAKFAEAEEGMLIKPHEITKMTNFQLEKADYFGHVGDMIQLGLLGSLSISKVRGKMVSKPKFEVKKTGKGKNLRKTVVKIEDKTWRLKFDAIRQENYYPDPTGRWMYEIVDDWMDLADVKMLAEGDDAIYEKAKVDLLKGSEGGMDIQEFRKARETGQDSPVPTHRPMVKITELWGSAIDKAGNIVHENVVATLANDRILIRKPTANPLWHQESPITKTGLLKVANSVWHTALMDAPVLHNRSMIELYNLFVDAAMKQVHGISQIRKDVMDNPGQVSNGIPPGTAIGVTSSLPVGAKVLEPLVEVEVPADALNIFNIMQQEFNSSALTNDLRQGVIPFRAVKATEVVEASQTITSIFQGIAKNFEQKFVIRELELAWMTVAQNWDKISLEEFVSLFGNERGRELSQLDPQEVFVSTVNGIKFRVFGVSLTLSRANDFQRLTTLLQAIGSSEVLVEEFAKRFDFGKLLGEIMTSLNIDKHKIALEAARMGEGAQPLEPGGAQPGVEPDTGSQVPQAATLGEILGGAQIPTTEFPASPAVTGGQ